MRPQPSLWARFLCLFWHDWATEQESHERRNGVTVRVARWRVCGRCPHQEKVKC